MTAYDLVVGGTLIDPGNGIHARRPTGSWCPAWWIELEDGRFNLADSEGTIRVADRRLVPVAAVRAGQRVRIVPLATEAPAGISRG